MRSLVNFVAMKVTRDNYSRGLCRSLQRVWSVSGMWYVCMDLVGHVVWGRYVMLFRYVVFNRHVTIWCDVVLVLLLEMMWCYAIWGDDDGLWYGLTGEGIVFDATVFVY